MTSGRSQLPLYIKIKEYLKDQIVSGELLPGEKIPSEPKLAEMFTVSRLTARNAVTELVNENYIYRKHGEGTFVSKPRVETNNLAELSLRQNVLSKGYSIHSTVLSISELAADKELRELLDLRFNEKVFILKRLRYINDIVTVLQESFVPQKFCPDFMSVNWETESLYETITDNGRYQIGKAKETLEAVIGTQEILNCLAITERTPVLYSERLTRLTDNTPVEFVKSWYRSDKYKFEIELN